MPLRKTSNWTPHIPRKQIQPRVESPTIEFSGERFEPRKYLQQKDEHRHGGEPRLDTVPESCYDGPDQGRKVSPEDTEADPGQDRIRYALLLTRHADEVHQEVHGRYADHQRQKHLPAR